MRTQTIAMYISNNESNVSIVRVIHLDDGRAGSLRSRRYARSLRSRRAGEERRESGDGDLSVGRGDEDIIIFINTDIQVM